MGASSTTIYFKISHSQSLDFEFDHRKPKIYLRSPRCVCFCAVLAVRAFLGRQRIGLGFGFGGRAEKRPRFTGQFASLRSSWGFERTRKEGRRGNKKKIASSKEGALFSRHRIRNDPNTKMNWVLLLLAGAAAMAAVASAAFQTGPCANTPACKCKWSEGKRMADCRNAGFNAVPETLSDDIQVQFSALILFSISPLCCKILLVDNKCGASTLLHCTC